MSTQRPSWGDVRGYAQALDEIGTVDPQYLFKSLKHLDSAAYALDGDLT